MERPFLQSENTWLGISLEVISVLAVAFPALLIFWNYGQLPAAIPSHFDGLGYPDDFRARSVAWLLPLFSLVAYLGMTWLSRKPHIFNYPVPITPENARAQYANAVLMLRWVKAFILISLALLVFFQREVSLGYAEKLPAWLLPTMAGSVVFVLVYFITRAFRLEGL